MAANPEVFSGRLEGNVAAARRPGSAQEEEGEAAGGALSCVDQGRTIKAEQAGHPTVAMEITSTDFTSTLHLHDAESKELPGDENGLSYTYLSSDKHSHTDSTYFTGISKKGTESPDIKEFSGVGPRSPKEIPTFDSRGLLSSDSGIEMTPAECSEVNKSLADPTEEEKQEAYKYIDISRSPDMKPQQVLDKDFGENKASTIGQAAPTEQQAYDSVTMSWQKDHYNGNISEYLPYVPYMEEPRKDFGLYNSPTSKEPKSAPVTISFTGMETTLQTEYPENQQGKSDKGLKLSPDMVPTVTVSEPEDNSPESITPPSTDADGYTEPSGLEEQRKYKISEDELISAIKAKEGTKGFSSETNEEKQSYSFNVEKQDFTVLPTRDAPAPLDMEGSSTESGDSEIELVSEDQVGAEEAMQSAYMTFSHIGGPPPSPASPSIQYSILREEREAELDSELIIESCDGSSASEESPKRDQDSPMMKPMIMDIIEEENLSRAESFDASDFESCSLKERKLNMENLAESACYLKGTYHTEIRADMPSTKKEELLPQKKSPEGSAYQSKVLGKTSTLPLKPLPFLSKRKAIELLYWRDIKQTGIVFGSVLLMLFSLTQFSVVSVIAYLALAALSATISFRIYKSVLQAVQKTDEGHPFKSYLDMEISLSQEQIQKYTDCLQAYTNSIVKELRRLFLVQDLVDSLKFAVLMWLLTYVGALFNGLTLLIMAVVSMFSLPVVYDKYQAQIDQYLGLVRTNMNTIVTKIQAKIPGTKQKE
ncbi:hypothetical protein XENTR_v10021836 [Xenopus tropicalis]|uniref:Reticulon-1 n=1 Tax=Xenopus tropicalis TaxID=8364 RepID=RTN1_XENTR|nr:reticulon-1 [Xenopus tropicalis]A7MC64.2 RecName: Full=Reticulon-1 [Xenopus tropicalis]KAE8587012.1 hypothetical protein XENTR_v10021836 [Xenopus tropicalis]|eukprot:NP_001078819.2 reticulon-1 [Xenopus tropicalis]